MNVKLYNELIAAIGQKALEHYGIDPEERSWRKYQEVYLVRYGQKEIQRLIALAEAHPKAKGAKSLIQDCQFWIRAIEGEGVKPRSVSGFESVLRQRLVASAHANVAAGRPTGPRLYKRDEARGVWYAHYVSKTEYYKEVKERDRYYPAHATLNLVWVEFGGRRGDTEDFQADDCLGMTVEEALARKGYVMENAEYERRHALFHAYVGKIGKQFLATGAATDDMDGNPKGRDSSWYWSRTKSIQLDKTGEPSRVVIDVFHESDKDDDRGLSDRNTYIDRLWWHRTRAKQDDDVEDDTEGDNEDLDAVDPEQVPEPEVPLHPMLACFDMRRHLAASHRRGAAH